MGMSDEGFEHAMRVLSRDVVVTGISPLVPEDALDAFMDRIEADKPMHINDALPLAGEGQYRHALLTILMGFPQSIVLEAWPRFVDNKPSSLKKLIEQRMETRDKALHNARAQKSEHLRRKRISGDDKKYPKDYQTTDQRRDFVKSLLGRGS